MTQSIEQFQTQCAKWKLGLERLMWILPLSFFVGFLAGFFGGKNEVLKSELIDQVNRFEKIEFAASIVVPFMVIYFFMYLTKQILAHFAEGEFFDKAVFDSVSRIGSIALLYGLIFMPVLLVVLMLIFAADFTAFDVLLTYVNGLDFMSIVLGLILILIGHALNVAKVYYQEQQLTI